MDSLPMGVSDYNLLILDRVLEMQRRHDSRLASIDRRLDRLVILLSTRPGHVRWSKILTSFFSVGVNPPLRLLAGAMVLWYVLRGGDAESAIGFLLKLIAL
jgi:hypothetical protein